MLLSKETVAFLHLRELWHASWSHFVSPGCRSGHKTVMLWDWLSRCILAPFMKPCFKLWGACGVVFQTKALLQNKKFKILCFQNAEMQYLAFLVCLLLPLAMTSPQIRPELAITQALRFSVNPSQKPPLQVPSQCTAVPHHMKCCVSHEGPCWQKQLRSPALTSDGLWLYFGGECQPSSWTRGTFPFTLPHHCKMWGGDGIYLALKTWHIQRCMR